MAGEDDFDIELDQELKQDFDPDEISTTRSPQYNDSDSLKTRVDPSQILFQFKLDLIGAYQVQEKVSDEDTGETKTIVKVKRKKNFKPVLNKQGVEEIFTIVQLIVNRHSILANLATTEEYNKRMLYISHDLVMTFITKRTEWGYGGKPVSINDIAWLFKMTRNFIDITLTSPVGAKALNSLGETYKETTQRNVEQQTKKGSILDRIASGMMGRRGK